MATPWLATLLAVIAVSVVSLIGIVAGLSWLRRHPVIITLVAMAAGSLLGDALLHLLPEAAEMWGGFTPALGALVLVGFGVFFLLESTLRFGHAHGEIMEADHGHAGHEHGSHMHASAHDSPHAATPVHAVGAPAGLARAAPVGPTPRIAPFGWMNLLGDGLHNFLDGIVIAASFAVDTSVGVATTVAVFLHEIPQELGDFAVLIKAGMAPRKAVLFNLLSAAAAVVGAALFLALPLDSDVLERIAVPIAAGGFLYIAAADLIPELHHHTGDRHVVNILLGFVLGLASMAGLLLLE